MPHRVFQKSLNVWVQDTDAWSLKKSAGGPDIHLAEPHGEFHSSRWSHPSTQCPQTPAWCIFSSKLCISNWVCQPWWLIETPNYKCFSLKSSSVSKPPLPGSPQSKNRGASLAPPSLLCSRCNPHPAPTHCPQQSIECKLHKGQVFCG